MMKKWVATVLVAALLLTAAFASLSIQVGAITYGDVSGDGNVDMKDVLTVRKYVAGMNPTPFDFVAADVDGDGAVTMKDVLKSRKFIANLIETLQPEGSVQPSEEPGDVTSVESGDVTSEEPTSEPTSEPSALQAATIVIYDDDVTGSLKLAPGAVYKNADITAALKDHTMAYGYPERYIITVTGDASPQDYVYPCILDASDIDHWPSKSYESYFKMGDNSTIYGSIPGAELVGSLGRNLYFYAENGKTTAVNVTLRHIKIEAVHTGIPVDPSDPSGTSGEPTSTPTIEVPENTVVVAEWHGNNGADGRPSYAYGDGRVGLQLAQYASGKGYIVGDPETNVNWYDFLKSHGDLAEGEYLVLTYEGPFELNPAAAKFTTFKGFGYLKDGKAVTALNAALRATDSKVEIWLAGPLTIDSAASSMEIRLSGTALSGANITDSTTMTAQIRKIGSASPEGPSDEPSDEPVSEEPSDEPSDEPSEVYL